MRRMVLLAGVLLALFVPRGARADELAIPGLSADAARYQRTLAARFPAGGTARQRDKSEAAANDADRRNDAAAGAAAWAERAGQGEVEAGVWLALARDLMRRPTPDFAHALDAAWLAFGKTQEAETPEGVKSTTEALALMREALAKLERSAAELDVLTYAANRSPDDADLRTQLTLRRQQLGLLLRGVATEPESFPARACLKFLGEPGGQADFHPGDWVRLAPPLPDAAVTLEDKQLCVSGLRPGTTTRVVVRAGMPGRDGANVLRDQTLDVAMPDRQPRVVLDGQRFLQAKSAAAEIGVASVNLPTVKLEVVRISERAAQPFLASHPPGDQLAETDVESLRQAGGTVWTGTAAIPAFTRNDLIHTRLPLPPAVLAAPGLYAVFASSADDSARSNAAQLVLRTDLAPSTWQGDDGLTVQVRGYAAALPKAGVEVALVAADNDILATATTGDDGIARFARPLLRGGNGLTPAALHLRGPDGDSTVLNLTRPAFDLSDRGVSGRAIVEGTDAFIWLDRGIYRPGETVRAMALPRDPAGHPIATPLHAVVTRPNGQVFLDAVPPPGVDGALDIPIALSPGAQLGAWRVTLHTAAVDGPLVGETTFQVDAFVPARIAVDLTVPKVPLPPGRSTDIPVAVRFLYGAPGAGLSGTASVRIEANPTPFADYAGYGFGLANEQLPGTSMSPALAETDAQGNTAIPVDLSSLPDSTGALQAVVMASINDPAGRPVTEHATVPIRPAGPLIGIRAGADDGVFAPGRQASFDVVALDPDGKPIAMPGAKMTLVRQVPDLRLVVRHGVASYETQWRDQPVDGGTVDIPATAPLHLSWGVDYGRYKLQVVQGGRGLAAASRQFSAGWEISENADVPARVRVATDRKAYAPGDVAHVRIDAPYAGPAALLVVSNRVHGIQSIDIPAGGTTVDVPVGTGWGAGAYVMVHAFRPTDGQPEGHAVSERAIGVAWIGIDPSTRALPVSVVVPKLFRPRGPATVEVHAAPGASVTLAAVDEGVLRLTKFVSPDPLGWFMGQRALAVDIRDEWGRLLRPAEGTLATLREGGGGDNEDSGPPPPQRVVSLFAGPVPVGPDGVARIALDLPDFQGQLRLMAVAWQGDRVGSASSDVLVRDPLVAEALLPRFLAPGDTARFGVSLQNVELPAGAVHVAVAAAGALALDGPATLDVTLAANQRATVLTGLRAGDAGEGKLSLDVSGPGGFAAHHELSLFVHPARGRTTLVAQGELAPGASLQVVPATDFFVPGTWRASLSLGSAVRYNVGALVQALQDYPLSCLEQLTSRGLPLALLPDGATAGPDRAGRLARAVELALDKQRYDGGFGLWSSDDEAEPWLSPYATEFLLRAKKAGATVPQTAIDNALKYLGDQVGRDADEPPAKAGRAYAVYVLTMADHAPAAAIRRMATYGADALPTPLARAQLGAALSRIAEPQLGAAMMRAAFSAPARNYWRIDDGSAVRDQLATAVLISESGAKVPTPLQLAAALPGADLDPASLSTQEQAWAAAAGAVLARSGPALTATVDGKAVAGPLATVALTGPVALRNTGAASLWRSETVVGVARVAPPAARHLMEVKRNFFTMAGQPASPDKLPQNSDVVLLVEGRADDQQAHQAMLTAGLPAGWEVAGHLGGGKVAGMEWLGELTEPRSEAARDDRVTMALDLTPEKPDFRVAVLIRAVTPGDYEYPGLELADMYRPTLFARQGAVRVSVLPAP